ncbi:MAG: ferredoxin [Desulfobaccales bacterium]
MSQRFPYIVEEECIACGTCEELCPEVFRLNEGRGFAQVINPGGASEDKIQEAIDACPVQCIHWTDQG